MQLIRGLHNLKQKHKYCVATIGNFDGVHLGHQNILKRLKSKALALNVKLCVILFEPQPLEFFKHELAPSRLMGLREKLYFLEQLQVDQVLCLSFNEALKSMMPDEFVTQVLIKGLAVKYLVVGDDFRYGYNRLGDFKQLEEIANRHQFFVAETHTVMDTDKRISSTRIRQLLNANHLVMAERLLGRPITMIGRVTKGKQLGRKLGFPTANILVCRNKMPIQGVFLVRSYIAGQPVNGVANLGKRPTIGDGIILLEVHLFNFNGDLYNQILKVELIKKIREIKKFSSIDELKQAITKDTLVAHQMLAKC